MKRVNILYLVIGLEIGGTEIQLLELLKKLDREKYNPIVCCIKKRGVLADDIEKIGIRVKSLNMESRLNLLAFPKLIGILRKERIDILHTFLFWANILGRLAGRIARVPIIISGERCINLRKKKVAILIDRLTSRWADKIVVISKAIKNTLIKREKISPEKIEVVYNGIDLSSFRIEDKREKDSIPKVGIVGRLHPDKGHRYFLEAAAQIIKKKPKVEFRVVGNGPLRKELEALSNKLELSGKVIFAGERRDILKIISSLNILVLSSLEEGLGNVLLEAMATGKPVVATKVGGVPEVVLDGETGILVPPKNSDALARAILKLLMNRALARGMGQAGRKRVEKYFNIDRMVNETEKVYNNLIQEKLV